MRLKNIGLFIFFSFFLLFYPGNSYYFHIFAYQRPLFQKQEKKVVLNIKPFPYLLNKYSLPEITAEGALIIDLQSFSPIYEKNSDKKFLPASLTKIITALVAYSVYQPNQIITVKKTIPDGRVMNLVIGEKITVENLLYGILIHSANDAAFVLADNFGYQNFIELMNKKAREIGMRNSYFTNPTGLEDSNNYSTPFDLALVSKKLLSNPYLSKIVATKEIVVSDIDYQYFHQLINVNKLLGEIPGIGGLKTGYTENAGENLITFYKKNSHQILIIILKSLDRFEDTKNIISWLNNNLVYLTLNI